MPVVVRGLASEMPVVAGGSGAALTAVEQALGSAAGLSAVEHHGVSGSLGLRCTLGVINGWRKGRFNLYEVRTVLFVFFLCSSAFKTLERMLFLSEKSKIRFFLHVSVHNSFYYVYIICNLDDYKYRSFSLARSHTHFNTAKVL